MQDPITVWQFEDAFRRLSTRLFDDVHQSPERVARNEIYIEGLARVFAGLMSETAFDVHDGFLTIQSALMTVKRQPSPPPGADQPPVVISNEVPDASA